MTTKEREKSSVVNGEGTLTARDANRLNDIYILETKIGRNDYNNSQELYKEIRIKFNEFISSRRLKEQKELTVSDKVDAVKQSKVFADETYNTALTTSTSKPIKKGPADGVTQQPTQGRGQK